MLIVIPRVRYYHYPYLKEVNYISTRLKQLPQIHKANNRRKQILRTFLPNSLPEFLIRKQYCIYNYRAQNHCNNFLTVNKLIEIDNRESLTGDTITPNDEKRITVEGGAGLPATDRLRVQSRWRGGSTLGGKGATEHSAT